MLNPHWITRCRRPANCVIYKTCYERCLVESFMAKSDLSQDASSKRCVMKSGFG